MAAITYNQNHFDYAIIGGGCFGASTALALIREWPDARIVWFEGTNTRTASQDMSKIVRPNYEDEDYVAFVKKALQLWRTDPLYAEHYHETGWIQVIGEGSHANTIKGHNDRIISVELMQKMVGFQDKPKLEAGEKLRFNEDVGYADFDLAVEAVAKEASLLGVRREKREVTRLLVEGGVCRGVEAGDHSVVVEKETVVAAGPWTPRLLEKSKVGYPSDFFAVTAVGVATMPLKENEFDELKSMPILVTKGGAFHSISLILFRLTCNSGEVIPSRKHKLLKITTTDTFHIQHPDELQDLKSFDVGKNRTVLEKMLPQFAGRQLSWWICPYVVRVLC